MSLDKNELPVKQDDPQKSATDASDSFRNDLLADQENFAGKLVAFAELNKREITLPAADLEKILPDFAQLIKDANIQEMSISKEGDSHYRFKVTMPANKEVPQDFEKDGCDRLLLEPEFSFDIQKQADGNILINNFSGVSAAIGKLSGAVKKVELNKVEKDPQDPSATDKEYETEIKSGAKGLLRIRTNTKRDSIEVFEHFQNAMEQLSEEFEDKARTSALEFPSIFRSV